ncbi:MAG: gluconeogenesis factor YvcK family protein [Thermodesulfobacteriota bacterium]
MTQDNATITSRDLGDFAELPIEELVERIVELSLAGPLGDKPEMAALFEQIEGRDTSGLNVVVFGGGTGLSNLVGGDSRHPAWPLSPFHGLKEFFPATRSIVCITDDGGSTGELLKDLDLVAVGDLRHVLLSSVSRSILHGRYGLNEAGCLEVAAIIHRLFNYRFATMPTDLDSLLVSAGIDLGKLPVAMGEPLAELLALLFSDERLQKLLLRPHCLGNLLVVSAICNQSTRDGFASDPQALLAGFRYLAELLGAAGDAVLPCTTTPAHLKLLYSNGVMVSGEYKAGHARRGCPVERVFVCSHGEPQVPGQVLDCINSADIIIFAPGSLYTSIIPILQLPAIAGAIRDNRRALKLLVANLWVQKGETDLVACSSGRRFHVSDLILAYNRNIPGGINGLFNQVMVLGLQDIPGSILQSYALEGKVPIYMDRDRVSEFGLMPIEGRIFSERALEEKEVVQHDPLAMARAVRAVWCVRDRLLTTEKLNLPDAPDSVLVLPGESSTSSARRLSEVKEFLGELEIDQPLEELLIEIIWRHRDISLEHLSYLEGVKLVDSLAWNRPEECDRIFSFYDPVDRLIKIRNDIFSDKERFELAFLVALGESLLGNYASSKEMRPVENEAGLLGRVFQLTLRPEAERRCFLGSEDLREYLELARMTRSEKNDRIYTRLVTGTEGFTPPGLLFGLVYAWYLDNRFAAHIEYKMAILRMDVPDMIPEQVKVCSRRSKLVKFFRRKVFGYSDRYQLFPSVFTGP